MTSTSLAVITGINDRDTSQKLPGVVVVQPATKVIASSVRTTLPYRIVNVLSILDSFQTVLLALAFQCGPFVALPLGVEAPSSPESDHGEQPPPPKKLVGH
jgi:hypothetical protein